MGQTHSAPPADAQRFRLMARAAYFGHLDDLRAHFRAPLVALQVSRATYLDICVHEQSQVDVLTDSLEREQRTAALQDEKMEFFSAIEKGRIVLGDTVLHIAMRLGHEAIVDFLLLTDHVARPPTSGPAPPTRRTPPSSHGKMTATRTDSRGASAPPKSTGSGLNSTQTPNFKGELPSDVAATPVLRLVLDTVADVHDVFGVEYADESKVHRLVRVLQRVWPLWMYDGQQEAANLVRVLYDVRASDAAFGGLVKVTLAVSERFQTAVSHHGVALAAKLLADCGGEVQAAKSVALSQWDADHKRALLFAVFRDLFRSWRHRRHRDRDQQFVEFFDSAMDAWLTIAQELQLSEKGSGGVPSNELLRRYDLSIWKRRLRPPPAELDDLCIHISALESYLDLAHLKVV